MCMIIIKIHTFRIINVCLVGYASKNRMKNSLKIKLRILKEREKEEGEIKANGDKRATAS